MRHIPSDGILPGAPSAVVRVKVSDEHELIGEGHVLAHLSS